MCLNICLGKLRYFELILRVHFENMQSERAMRTSSDELATPTACGLAGSAATHMKD